MHSKNETTQKKQSKENSLTKRLSRFMGLHASSSANGNLEGEGGSGYGSPIDLSNPKRNLRRQLSEPRIIPNDKLTELPHLTNNMQLSERYATSLADTNIPVSPVTRMSVLSPLPQYKPSPSLQISHLSELVCQQEVHRVTYSTPKKAAPDGSSPDSASTTTFNKIRDRNSSDATILNSSLQNRNVFAYSSQGASYKTGNLANVNLAHFSQQSTVLTRVTRNGQSATPLVYELLQQSRGADCHLPNVTNALMRCREASGAPNSCDKSLPSPAQAVRSGEPNATTSLLATPSVMATKRADASTSTSDHARFHSFSPQPFRSNPSTPLQEQPGNREYSDSTKHAECSQIAPRSSQSVDRLSAKKSHNKTSGPKISSLESCKNFLSKIRSPELTPMRLNKEALDAENNTSGTYEVIPDGYLFKKPNAINRETWDTSINTRMDLSDRSVECQYLQMAEVKEKRSGKTRLGILLGSRTQRRIKEPQSPAKNQAAKNASVQPDSAPSMHARSRDRDMDAQGRDGETEAWMRRQIEQQNFELRETRVVMERNEMAMVLLMRDREATLVSALQKANLEVKRLQSILHTSAKNEPNCNYLYTESSPNFQTSDAIQDGDDSLNNNAASTTPSDISDANRLHRNAEVFNSKKYLVHGETPSSSDANFSNTRANTRADEAPQKPKRVYRRNDNLNSSDKDPKRQTSISDKICIDNIHGDPPQNRNSSPRDNAELYHNVPSRENNALTLDRINQHLASLNKGDRSNLASSSSKERSGGHANGGKGADHVFNVNTSSDDDISFLLSPSSAKFNNSEIEDSIIRDESDVEKLRTEFLEAKKAWLTEKGRVISYQRRLQSAYTHLLKKNRFLERELNSISLTQV